MQTRGLIQLVVFIAVLIVFLYLHQHFRALDHALGIAGLIAWVVLGMVALWRTYSSNPAPSMPSFAGALPPRWRRWIMGE